MVGILSEGVPPSSPNPDPFSDQKPYPIPDQWAKCMYPFFCQKGPKTIPFGAAHTYMVYGSFINRFSHLLTP